MAGFTTQGAMLSSLDMGQAIVDLQTDPDVTMVEYLATQAVVLRLIDPGGLGRFGVLIMSKRLAGCSLSLFSRLPHLLTVCSSHGWLEEVHND